LASSLGYTSGGTPLTYGVNDFNQVTSIGGTWTWRKPT
jgi:hypothetical protein